MQKLTAFWQKHKRILCCIALALAMLFVTLCVCWVRVLPARTKSISMKLNDNYAASTPPIENSLSQTFVTDQSIFGISTVFRFPEEQPIGKLHLRLLNAETGEELSHSTGEMRNIISGQYTTMGLDIPVMAGTATHYELILEPEYETDARISVGCSKESFLDGVLSVEGEYMPGTIALSLSIDQISGFLLHFYLGVMLPLVAMVCAVYWLATGPWKGLKHLHKLYALALASLGLAFCIVLPPYAVPDEQFHINQAFSNATRMATYLDFDGWHLSSIPLQTTYRRPGDINPVVQDENTTVFTWRTVHEDLGSRNHDGFGAWKEYEGEFQADNSNLLYTFSSLGVLLGFMLHLGFVPCLFLGRLTNFVVFLALTTWAVKKAPFGKPIFAAAGLLPMTLHLAVSFSRDSLLLALAFAWTAMCLDAAFGPYNKLNKKQLLGLAALGLILAPAKSVYLPLTGLCLLIPAARLGRHPRGKQIGFLALCCVVFLFSSARFQLANFLGLNQAVPVVQDAPAVSDAAPEEEAPELEAGAVNPDEICFTPGYMISHPGLTAKLVINSAIDNADHYVRSLVGGNLSYYTIRLSWGWVLLCYALLMLCTMRTSGEHALPPVGRFWALAAGLACCALAVLGCISWTPTYYTSIYGLQGRYFLPALPALLLALQPKNGPHWPKSAASGLTTAFAVVDVGMLLNVILVIIAR